MFKTAFLIEPPDEFGLNNGRDGNIIKNKVSKVTLYYVERWQNMRAQRIGYDLTQGKILNTMIKFSLPFMMANLLQVAYNMIDMIVVGHYVGSVGVSAVSNGGDLIHLFTMAMVGFSSAGQIIVSQYVGKGDAEGKKRAIGTLFTTIAGISLLFMIIGLIFSESLLRILKVPAEAIEQAGQYSIVCFCGMLFVGGYNLISAILRGMGDSKRPFIFIAVAAILNLILDLIFVVGLRLGAFGAALATVIGQTSSFILAYVYLYHKREAFGFDFKLKSFKIDPDIMKSLFQLGIPMALQHSAVQISKLFVTSYINSYGVTASAVNGIGNKLTRVSNMITQSLGTACTSMIGQNFGAGKKDRVKQVVHTCLGVAAVVAAILSGAVLLFPQQIFSLFTPDPEVLAMAAEVYLYIAALEFIANGVRTPMMALVNGVGNSGLALAIGLVDGVVARIFLSIFLGVTCAMGIVGFWLGAAIASFMPFIIGGTYFWSGLWMKRKSLTEK